MNKHFLPVLFLLSISILCSSCSLLPEEEVYSRTPVVNPYEKQEYKTTEVLRGDLALIRNVRCTYMPVDQEKLSFSLGGQPVDKIYVSQGQTVKTGQLLAELEMDDLKEQIAGTEYNMAVLAKKQEHIRENLELEILYQEAYIAEAEEKREAKYRANPEAERGDDEPLLSALQEQAFAQKKVDYAKQLQETADSLTVQSTALAEMKQKLEKSQIYAGINGTVTYVKEIKEDFLSTADEVMIVITDLDSSAFSVKGTDAALFSEGMEVTIVSGKKEYAALVSRVVPAEEEENRMVYFSLPEPDPLLQDDDKGTIEVTLDSRSDCLYVDKAAVKTSNGQSFVYIPDSEGLRAIQTVTVGLANDDYVEITSGLSEHDTVILD